MPYDEIAEQEGIISRLRSELRQVRAPARTINWQHNNIGATRGITQRILVARKQRKQINSQISASESKLVSLRRAVFGD